MIRAELIATIADARARLPSATWEQFVHAVRAEVGTISYAAIARVLQRVGNADVRHRLEEALMDNCGVDWSAALASVETVAYCASQAQSSVEMVWTGPSSGSFAARRIDQILYDLLEEARERVFFVTFSAYRVARLTSALIAAQARGVKITLLLETNADSDGQLSNDALSAFSDLQLEQIEVLHWPKGNRELNAAGKPGKLHAKCAVIDGAVVISSANLTDDAFNRNMEMGVVVRDVQLAESVMRHFAELKADGHLRAIL